MAREIPNAVRVMVFGASGYIGKNLCAHLSNQGYEVISVFRGDNLNDASAEGVARLTSSSDAESLIVEYEPGLVINVSNFFARTANPSDIETFADVNTVLMSSICKGCVEAGSILVHVGSAWEATFDENDPSLGNTYAMFKGLASKIAKWYKKSFNLRFVQLNLFDTYGAGDTRGKIVQFLVEQIGSSTRLDLSGGEQVLELVYVDDVVACIESVARYALNAESLEGPDGEDFACFPTAPLSLKQIVQTIESVYGQDIPVNWGARPYRTGEMFKRDLRGMKVVPGWEQRVSLEAGIQKLRD